jgi:hypothetical protein
MKSILKILLITLVIAGCKQSPRSEKLTYDVTKDIPNILKAGKHEAHIMDGVKLPPGVAEIQTKIQASIRKNYDWFVAYMAESKGQPLAYHENFGVTKEEYEKCMEGLKNVEVISTGRESLTIFQSGNIFSFKGTGRLNLLDSVRIDMNEKKVFYNKFTMPFEDTVRVSDEKNGLKSKWFGYSFLFSDPEDTDMSALKDLPNLNMTRFQLVVGRIEKDDRTLMDFNAVRVVNGQRTWETRLPVVFE